VTDADRPTTFLHPISGLLILGLDWLFFSGSLLSLGLSTPLSVGLGGGLGTVGTTLFQRTYGADSWPRSIGTGVLAGLVVGLPFPIAGTVAGGAVLALSGLRSRSSGASSSQKSVD
jgi:hypothetical protein